MLTGRGVSPGVAVGRAVVAVRDARHVRYRLASSGVDRERQRLRSARERTRVELEEISSRVSRTVGPAQAAIFAAQLLMLDDPLFVRRADELIRSERINGDWAVERAIAELHQVFAREGDAWLRERVGDLADVAGRLQRNLRPGRDPLVDLVHELDPPLILVADELPPSVAAQLDWTRVRGLVCDVGSPTHHTVILVRSLGIPTVVGLGGATEMLGPGQTLALDGTTGEVVVEPSSEALERWHERAEVAAARRRALEELRARPAATADGLRIRLEANVGIIDEVTRARDAGAEGIGLFRSEFLIDPAHPAASSEEAQFETYRFLLEKMNPLPVTIRTFDAGDERRATARPGGHRERFGLRGIRAALQHDERFRAQMRALLRAAPAGTLRVLLPFVTSSDELRAARALIDDIRREAGATHDRADRRDDRGAGGRAHGRSSRPARRFPERRHERPDPVHSGDRSHRRAPRGPLRADGAGGAAAPADHLARGPARPVRSGRVRRGGGRSAAGRAPRGPRLPDVQHDAVGNSGRQAQPDDVHQPSGARAGGPGADRRVGRRGARAARAARRGDAPRGGGRAAGDHGTGFK